jgi:hypothetical protein
MDVSEPRVRRRGFFLQSDPGEPDTGEHENPEGFGVRIPVTRHTVPRQVASVAASSGRSPRQFGLDEARPPIRSGSATGSRQRAHLPR